MTQIERLRARRAFVLARREALRQRRENAGKMVRLTVEDSEGRKRHMLVSPEVASIVRSKELRNVAGKFTRGMRVFAFSEFADAADILTLDAGGPLSHIQQTDWSHGAWFETPLGTYRRNDADRRASTVWVAPAGTTIAQVQAAWAQRRAGSAFASAMYVMHRRERAEAFKAAQSHRAKANAPKLRSARWEAAKARQLAAIRDQRAALTAQAVARGDLTND